LKEANAELHNEVTRLRSRLEGVDKIYKKYQYSKMNYAQLLAQLEKSEMQRREIAEDLKAQKKKVHKLNKEKRILQEECARNFGNTSLKMVPKQ